MSKMRSARARMGANCIAGSKDDRGIVEQPASAPANEACSSPRRPMRPVWLNITLLASELVAA
jgi:hypothetical protein